MHWLTLILHLFIGSTLAGTGVIAVLVMGQDAPMNILWFALAGYAVAVPVSVVVAKVLKG